MSNESKDKDKKKYRIKAPKISLTNSKDGSKVMFIGEVTIEAVEGELEIEEIKE